MDSPLLSVIIPAYNAEEFLPNALESVLNQTYTHLEVIVVNDGSIDGTAAVIEQYISTDKRVRAIHQENGGVTSARLKGICSSTGEWITFVDSDDFVEPEMYKRLIENAISFGVDISHCGYQMVFPNRVDYYYNTGGMKLQNHLEGLSDLMTGKIIEPGLWNKVYHRRLFKEFFCGTRMDTSIKINEDLLMNYILFSEARTSVFEDICPYHYLVRSGSAANSTLNKHHLRDPIKVLHIIQEDAPAELQDIILQRLTRQLISGTTMGLQGQPELVKPFRIEAGRELRQRMGRILRSQISVKLKIMALWASVWPASYRWVHSFYGKLTGIDKKYDI